MQGHSVVVVSPRLGSEREPALKITPPPKWFQKPCRLIAETFLNSAYTTPAHSSPVDRRARTRAAPPPSFM